MADEPQAPPAPQIPASPWQQDLTSRFDAQTAAQVDTYLRERWQPRVTQLEQQYAETQSARELLASFQSDPVGTFNGVKQELINAGYTVEQATAAAQQQHDAAVAAPPAPAPAQTAAAQTEDPRLAEMYADWTRQRELQAYDAEIARIVNDPTNADINPNRLHTFVAAADGDFTKALDMYRADVADVLTAYGIDPSTATPQQQEAAAAEAQAAANGAPPVMSAGAGGAPVPTQADYAAQGLTPTQALHKSIEDAAANMVRSGQSAPPIA